MESLRRQFEDMMCIIIDEMSMVGADFFYYIHKRMVEITRSEDLFGNRALLLVGDLLQIPPVGQTSIYSEPKNMQNNALYKSDDNLWDSCETVHLITNKRQGNCPWRETLDRIRIGQMNEDDEKLLETRRVSNEEHKNKNYDNALHLFYSNNEVCEHNKAMLAKLDGNTKDFQANLKGYPKGSFPQIKYDTFIEETRLHEYLSLKNGTRVMLIHNIDIADGLVNGVAGTVIGYAYDNSTTKPDVKGSNVRAIIVKFDDPKVGLDLKKKKKNDPQMKKFKDGVPISRCTLQIYPDRFRGSLEINVEQFPLNLFYASTSHKIQGRTLKDEDVVCHTSYNMKPGCGYVMLSRNSKLENVYISKDFDFEKVRPHLPSLKMNNQLVKMCIAAILKEKKFDIFYANMRGKSNLINVQFDPFADQSNLVCLVETNLERNEKIDPWKERRSFSHASSGRGSGVCAYAKEMKDETSSYRFVAKKIGKRFQIMQLKLVEKKTLEFGWNVIKEKFQIFILYVSHDQDAMEVAHALKTMVVEELPIIVLGDFNFDSNMEWNSLSNYLKNTLQLQQIVTEATYLYGKNIIDHIYVPKDLVDKISQNSRFNYYGDHKSFNICFT